MFPTILIVDDETSILQSLGGILQDEGFDTIGVENGYEALKALAEHSPELVLLDIWMPGMDGIDTLKEIRSEHPTVPVVMITGHGTIETAVKAIKLGAYDFIEKPLSIEKVVVTINNALNFRRLEEENRYLRKKTLEKHSITGMSPPVQALVRQIQVAAPTDAWVLITGENGTGKELVARTIHYLSPRSDQPMVVVDCATLGDHWVERELFGHEKGAFEGAEQRRRGRFELAGKGTLFLDEVGELGLKTQAKLLRVLEDGKFQRLGGGRDIDMEVRIIASTNKNLEQAIKEGTFREDLYYRLNVVPVAVPPLRQRVDDIPLLVDDFLKEYHPENPQGPTAISEEAMELLRAYPWPGNVRELKNLMERLVLTMSAERIEAGHLPEPYGEPSEDVCATENLYQTRPLSEAKKVFERAYVAANLAMCDQDVEACARAIGVDPDTIGRKTGKS
ncbi:MAG: sigma-54-dependent transcriptional regulator [Desulfatibacillaceae bacterium]